MQIWNILGFTTFWFITTVSKKTNLPPHNARHITKQNMFEPYKFISPFPPCRQKIEGYKQLIRYKNILPTTALAMAGGWMTTPSLPLLFTNPTFYTSIIATLLVMSSSMALNDIFDYELDKINNPTRPLARGIITRKEAVIFTLILFSITYGISLLGLPSPMRPALYLAMLNIILYTPVFKRIFLVKNITCSSLVAFAPIFTGFAVSHKGVEIGFRNSQLLLIFVRLVFLGSLQNEMLLDICDEEGDRTHDIPTLPVLLGPKRTLQIVRRIFLLNAMMMSYDLYRIFGLSSGIAAISIFWKPFVYLMDIPKIEINPIYIRYVIQSSTKTMVLSLVYLSILAKNWI